MKIRNMIAIRVLVVVVGFLVVLPLIVEARTVKLACGGQRTITAAVEKLNPGDTLLFEGACVENVLIPEQVVEVVIDGQGKATINGPDVPKATITVRGRNITIQNFHSITGGRDGVLVNRGGTATIINNTIQSTGNSGIDVSTDGFAAIVFKYHPEQSRKWDFD